MISWWEEFTKIPSHAGHQEFSQKVYASFDVPKACNQVKKVYNYHVQPLAHPSIGKHHFLPLRDVRFGIQDICLTQLHHTIAHARALQHWAKEVHSPVPGQPHHLVRSVEELWQAMEPLISYEEGEVFITMASSNWTEVTLPLLMETVPEEFHNSCTESSWAHPRGSLSVTCSEGWPATTAMWATAKAEAPTAPPSGVYAAPALI